ETCAEVTTHQQQTREVAAEIGAGVLGFGFAPNWTLEETPVMPKGRYKIMREYMPKVGGYGLDMMFRTCTVQVNLDFESEADMVKKFRVGLALQPITTALFANSPFREGRPSGFLSYRAQVWTDVDNARAGMLPWVFEGGMWRRICGMPALWVGCLYDSQALDAAWDLVKDWTAEERQAMRDAVGKQGFKTPFRHTTVHELAHRMLEISGQGLKRRASLDG